MKIRILTILACLQLVSFCNQLGAQLPVRNQAITFDRLWTLVTFTDDTYTELLDEQRGILLKASGKPSDPVPPGALAAIERIRGRESKSLDQIAAQVEIYRVHVLTPEQIAADNAQWAKVLAGIAMPDKPPAKIGAIARQRKFGALKAYLKALHAKEPQ